MIFLFNYILKSIIYFNILFDMVIPIIDDNTPMTVVVNPNISVDIDNTIAASIVNAN